MTWQSTNQIYAFFHGSRLVGQIGQISYICLSEKNFGKPKMFSSQYCSKKHSLCAHILWWIPWSHLMHASRPNEDFKTVGLHSYTVDMCCTVRVLHQLRSLYGQLCCKDPYQSRVAQWKRAGPITQRSVDRNHALLKLFFKIILMTHSHAQWCRQSHIVWKLIQNVNQRQKNTNNSVENTRLEYIFRRIKIRAIIFGCLIKDSKIMSCIMI